MVDMTACGPSLDHPARFAGARPCQEGSFSPSSLEEGSAEGRGRCGCVNAFSEASIKAGVEIWFA
jgi:hypothetical protein